MLSGETGDSVEPALTRLVSLAALAYLDVYTSNDPVSHLGLSVCLAGLLHRSRHPDYFITGQRQRINAALPG